jgi:glutathione S-transferase
MGALLLVAIVALALWWGWQKTKRRTYPVFEGHHPDVSVPYEQEFELYHNALSLCSMKARLCMAELGLPYKSHHIDLIETGSYENIRSKLLSVNPGGTVPVLVHDGHPIYESHAQIRYAAEHAPPGAPKLTPDDPALRAEMERWIDLSSLTHDPIEHGDESAGNAIPGLTLPLFAAMIDQIATWKILEGFLFHFDKKRPAIFLTFKIRGLEKVGGLGPAMKILARSRKQMAAHLDSLESQLLLRGGPWILGETFSLADVSWLVIFERLAQADCLHVFVGEGKRPACAAYWEALQKRDGYREAILGFPHPTIEYGTQRIRDAKAADPALRVALEGEHPA